MAGGPDHRTVRLARVRRFIQHRVDAARDALQRYSSEAAAADRPEVAALYQS
jgi:hypothetical protein